MAAQTSLLHTSGLTIGYQAGKGKTKVIAGPLDLELHAGQLICLLGPNGCGKSTLLRTIAGLQHPLNGEIILDGAALKKLKPAQVARKISLVLTDNVRSGNLDVYSLISLGRYPYSGWLGILTEQDKLIIEQAIRATHTAAFLGRKMDSLSDGECQKVMLARAMAQDTPLIILDEPTAHLDLPSRIQLMRLLHQLAKETNKAILLSTHELDLALQVADQIWLMSNGGHLDAGLPEELVLNGSFQQAFDKDGIAFDAASGTFNIHYTGKRNIKVTGEGIAAFWTKKALVRNGFNISLSDENELSVSVSGEGPDSLWTIQQNNKTTIYTSLREFLDTL
ncbi:iron complex transport system ATP-binding protein [Pedobacter cryoconitis]|uniref:Iron complex transport system ATP-binding protein n=1 Tax=Pedobacter cryoconitis TaxID=188932 RepID=A0A7W9E004_9SPHI|nr:ABC transporter ATP-binding protein [Pedobacter cryoconitis]MBB5637897.1 iron complex transport system ATP-binding protein [Pedobacter cryoconitis]MBB6270346.1 iron complex transport system ATP-binding protein [Pedobacter cryoconitis]